jgi:hypothetical protein
VGGGAGGGRVAGGRCAWPRGGPRAGAAAANVPTRLIGDMVAGAHAA